MTKKIVSILLVFALAVSLFAGSALAAIGDNIGTFADFPVFTGTTSTGVFNWISNFKSHTIYGFTSSGSNPSVRLLVYFTRPLLTGSFTIKSSLSPFDPVINPLSLYFFDSNAQRIGSGVSFSYDSPVSVPSGALFVLFNFRSSTSVSGDIYSKLTYTPSGITYSGFVYDSSSDYDPSLDQEILTGVEAIAKSFLDLETGPYSSTSGVSLNSDGVVTPTTRNDATLVSLLNLIGVSSTYSSLAIEQMNLNFGNYFEYHEIEDTSSGTVTIVKNLPSYVNALGMELTDGINKLQRDNLLIYQQGENIEDALYTDKTENQPWSVAQWLKDIYSAVSSFFSSFWSPAETALKTAAEDGMQAAADKGNAASGSQVDEVNSAADAFKSFGSTGNIGSGDVMDVFSDGASYEFFSQTTKDNLAYHPPQGGQRNLLRSSSPAPADQSEEEYVDELDDKLSYWREALGLP